MSDGSAMSDSALTVGLVVPLFSFSAPFSAASPPPRFALPPSTSDSTLWSHHTLGQYRASECEAVGRSDLQARRMLSGAHLQPPYAISAPDSRSMDIATYTIAVPDIA
eukprot:3463842-Rhodomonas_salina.3